MSAATTFMSTPSLTFMLVPASPATPRAGPSLRANRAAAATAAAADAAAAAAVATATTVAGDVEGARGQSSTLAAVAATGAVFLAIGGSRRRRIESRTRNVVAMRDGSDWGNTGYGASTSLDTKGPLPFVRLTRGGDEAVVYLMGGCVTSYKTNGTEWLAVRPDAMLDGSKPISGGLPHCFPQFGPGEIQQHGFARNLPWRLLEEPSEAGVCVLELTDSDETRAMWPHAFRCEYRVELLEGKLATTLKVENTSASDFNFTTALHSYYSTFNVSACKIQGDLKGSLKLDKTQDPPTVTTSDSDVIQISKFTEEIYKEVLPGSVSLTDPAKGTLEIVSGGGWRDVVVWNPFGDEKMGADGFVCVESAALAPVQMAPNAVWEATMDLVPKPNA